MFCFVLFCFFSVGIVTTKDDAKKFFSKFFEKEGFSVDCSKEEFCSRMLFLLENRRLSADKASGGKDKRSDFPNNSTTNEFILSHLVGSKEGKKIVETQLSQIYDEISAVVLKIEEKANVNAKKHSKDDHKEKGKEKDKEKVPTREQREPREAETKQVEEAEQEEDEKTAQKTEKPGKAHKGQKTQKTQEAKTGDDTSKLENVETETPARNDDKEVLQEKKRQRTTIKDKFIEYFASKFVIEAKQQESQSGSGSNSGASSIKPTIPNFIAVLVLQTSIFWQNDFTLNI